MFKAEATHPLCSCLAWEQTKSLHLKSSLLPENLSQPRQSLTEISIGQYCKDYIMQATLYLS